MFKQKTILEVKGAEDRIYTLEFDPSSPLGEMHDALYTMKSVILERINQIEKKEQTSSEDEKKDECDESCKNE